MSLARLTRLAAAAALALAASGALAQASPSGFLLQTFEPAPAGDRLFVTPDTSVGACGPAGSLTLSWATDPLVLRQDGAVIPGGLVVHRQLWAVANASLPLAGKVLLDLSVPVALHQSGSQPFSDLAKVSASGLGDLRLGARYPFFSRQGYSLAAAADLWLPSGSKPAFASDGETRFEGKLIASADRGPFIYGASLGYLYRPERDVGFAVLGSGVSFTAGAAWSRGPFRVGPELFGRFATAGKNGSPLEGLIGAHLDRGPWDFGAAVGTSFNEAPGAAPFRLLAQVTWKPGQVKCAKDAADKAAADKAAADKAAADKAAADKAAADMAAADMAAADKAAADKAAADKAAADKAAADKAAADMAAADKAAADKAAAALAAVDTKLVKLTDEKIEILQSVLFESSMDVIRPESVKVLASVANVLRGHPEITKVRVEGHTDSAGPADYNLDLSQKRAQAVLSWLTANGVEASRLEAKGFGPSQSIADNASPDGRAKNRRVVFSIVK